MAEWFLCSHTSGARCKAERLYIVTIVFTPAVNMSRTLLNATVPDSLTELSGKHEWRDVMKIDDKKEITAHGILRTSITYVQILQRLRNGKKYID